MGIVLLELFVAAQGLRYNKPTAPEAYSFLRPAITQLKAVQTPTDRFLSLSGTNYDPGDLKEIENIYSDQLPPRAIYDYVITAKQKEVLFFNLPMVYQLNAVDGYDGGLLPLKKFISLQQLFLTEDELSLDGRLRERLTQVPANHLLSLLGVKHIITDKVYDVWLNNIFYDLQFPAILNPNTEATIKTENIPDFSASAIGLVYHSSQDTGIIAEVVIQYHSGLEKRFEIEAKTGDIWENTEFGVDYNVVFDGLEQSNDSIKAIALVALAPITVQGVSLIQPINNTSRSIILTTEGNYETIHGGDVKIYKNLNVYPRAFIVHQINIVPTMEDAIKILQNKNFKVIEQMVQVAQTNSDKIDTNKKHGLHTLGISHPQDKATIDIYTPEMVSLTVNLASPGWLILTDTYYPGWQATVDNVETEILEADIMFRAIAVPSGNHQVVFRYKSSSFYGGSILSFIGLGLLLLMNLKKSLI